MKPLHHEELAVHGVMRLIQEGARRRHLRVFKDRIPARLFVLEPAPDALPIGHSCFVRHVVSTVAEPLTERKYAQALALARPGEQGVELRAERLAHWRRDCHKFLRELVERVAQAVAEARPRKERADAFDCTVKTIGQDPPDPIRGLPLGRGALELSVGLGQGRCTSLFGVAYSGLQMN